MFSENNIHTLFLEAQELCLQKTLVVLRKFGWTNTNTFTMPKCLLQKLYRLESKFFLCSTYSQGLLGIHFNNLLTFSIASLNDSLYVSDCSASLSNGI